MVIMLRSHRRIQLVPRHWLSGYVLEDAKLQDGHKIPKWLLRARLGVFLGFSTLHSSQVPLVMNTLTGKILPQYHVIFDDKFETVLSMDKHESVEAQWKFISRLGQECEYESNTSPEGDSHLENPKKKRNLIVQRDYQDKRESHSQQKQ